MVCSVSSLCARYYLTLPNQPLLRSPPLLSTSPCSPCCNPQWSHPSPQGSLDGSTGFSAMPPRACQNSRKQSGKVSQWRPGALPDHSHDTDTTTLSASLVTSEDPVRCAPPTVPYEKQGVFVS